MKPYTNPMKEEEQNDRTVGQGHAQVEVTLETHHPLPPTSIEKKHTKPFRAPVVPDDIAPTKPAKIAYRPTFTDVIEQTVEWSDWCKTHQFNNSDFSKFVNKHAIKEWIGIHSPAMNTAKEYGYVRNATDITPEFLASFPSNRFLIKAAHLSGGILLVEGDEIKCLKRPCARRKNDEQVVENLKNNCQKFLQAHHALHGEVFYLLAERGCIFEEVLELGNNPQDYKVFFFHGRPHIVAIYGKTPEGGRTFNAYTPNDWGMIPFAHKKIPNFGNLPDRPLPFVDKMLVDAQRLYDEAEKEIEGLQMMRVDFFVYQKDKVAFAELTFAPNACGRRSNSDIQEKYYGFLASHPEYDIDPADFHNVIKEWKEKTKG